MEAYQFYATPENGIIRIPDEYKDRFKDTVKVIVLEEKPVKTEGEANISRRKSDMLLTPTMSTKGWKFSREVANERR